MSLVATCKLKVKGVYINAGSEVKGLTKEQRESMLASGSLIEVAGDPTPAAINAEKKRLADEAEAKRVEEEAEAKRIADEAEAKRLADEKAAAAGGQ